MKRNTLVYGVSAVIFLLTLNFFASRHFVRADLTSNKAYTLADATKKILSQLEDVVTVRMYITHDLPPQLIPLKNGVDDMLSEYRQFGGENIEIESRDPQADPQTERELMVMGIQPLQLNVVEKDKQEVAKIYLGLVLLYHDQTHVIQIDPRQPTRHLEEWLTGGIVKLTRDKTPVAGWWAPEQSNEGEGYHLIQKLLEDNYQVKRMTSDLIDLDPKKIDSLILMGRERYSDEELYALDRFLAEGGHVIAFVNRMNITPSFSAEPNDSGLEKLFQQYGVTVEPRLVGDAVNAYASFRSGYVTYSVPYPLWPSVRGEGLSTEHPVVSKLESLTLPWVSPLTIDMERDTSLSMTVLAKSSAFSSITPGEPPYTAEPQAATMLIPKSEGTPKNLIVELSGVLPDPYEGADALPKPKGYQKSETARQAAKLVVIGTPFLLQDRFVGQRQFAEGVTFFANLVDHQITGDDLLGIRSRPVTSRPIAHDLSAAEKSGIRMMNIVGVPLLLILFGLASFFLRKRKWKNVQQTWKDMAA